MFTWEWDNCGPCSAGGCYRCTWAEVKLTFLSPDKHLITSPARADSPCRISPWSSCSWNNQARVCYGRKRACRGLSQGISSLRWCTSDAVCTLPQSVFQASAHCQYTQSCRKIWFRNALNEPLLHCQPEVVFHIEGDSHVGGLPLYVELVTRFQADQEYVCEYFRTPFFQMATCKEGRRPGETKAAKPEREAVLVAARKHQDHEKFIRSYPQKLVFSSNLEYSREAAPILTVVIAMRVPLQQSWFT